MPTDTDPRSSTNAAELGAAEVAPAPAGARTALGRRVRVRRPDLVGLASVALVIAILAVIPVLRTHHFYYWDDSAAVFLPNWYLMGEQLRDGSLPLLNVDVWMGGNWAGEAQFGIWNPVVMANAVLVSLLPSLAISAIIIKLEFMVLLGTGVYLLSREYGARPAPAVAVAVALPFSGYALYFDTAAWVAGLIAFAFLPHLWWTARRFARGRLHPVVPLVAGVLAMTVGNPYAALGVVVVLFAVAVERLAVRDVRSVARLSVVGLAVGLTGAVVFLPLLGIQPVGWRAQGGFQNTGWFTPNFGQVLNLSSPSYLPRIEPRPKAYVPATYLSWFVVPLLPWFAWSVLARARERIAVLVVGGSFLLMVLGPSDMWLFRWPARLIEYLYLPVCVLLALLLSAGLRTDRLLTRGWLTAGLIAVQTYLTWANLPEQGRRAVFAGGVVTLLVAATLLATRYRRSLLTPALVAGTAVILALQLLWFPKNLTLVEWYFPHNVRQMRANFADRTDGNTLTVADAASVTAQAHPDGAWRELVFGNLSHVAGVPSLNSYSGMGYLRYGNELCLDYGGRTCPEAYDRVFAIDPDTGRPLADLLRLRTVVVRNGFLPGGRSVTEPPPGWEISHRTDLVTVIRRVEQLPHPDGRVAWTAPSVAVTSDRVIGRVDEELRYTGGGRVVIAALAWPGWRATVDGQPVTIREVRAGLMELDLPQRSAESTVRLTFEPVGLRSGLALLAVGLLLGAGYCIVHSTEALRRGFRSGRSRTNVSRSEIKPRPFLLDQREE